MTAEGFVCSEQYVSRELTRSQCVQCTTKCLAWKGIYKPQDNNAPEGSEENPQPSNPEDFKSLDGSVLLGELGNEATLWTQIVM